MNNVNYSDLKLRVEELCRQEKFPPSGKVVTLAKFTALFTADVLLPTKKNPKLQVELFAIACITEHNMG